MNETPQFAHAAVAAPHRLAAQAGRDILLLGGNAIEAMVAMAATIAVVYPHANAIGGDGFWLIREPKGKVRAIEACGFVGEFATIERYRALEFDAVPTRGPHAALTVPGAVGGWALALELSAATGGRLPLSLLLERAIRHAVDGYPVSFSEARYDPTKHRDLMEAPGFAETYLVEGQRTKAGALRKVAPLGQTLQHLADAGLADFYRGDVGREIAADLERIGSPVTRADLAQYRAVWRAPLAMPIEGGALFNTPPPTQGLASLILMGLFARLNVKELGGFGYFHGLIEASKRALAIRDAVVTDFDRMRHDCDALLAAPFLDRQAAKIEANRAASLPVKADLGDTVWMGAIDREGRAVSFIQSVYWEYGSGCVLPRTGVCMQNRGASFSLDAGAVNPLQPGRRPFHTLNPALAVFDDGRVAPYGSMGGDGQPQFQAQVLTRYLMGQNLSQAVDAPRFLFGRSWGAPSLSVKLEEGFDDTVAASLARAGHEIEWTPRSDMFGHAGALVRGPRGAIEAAHDPRSDGGAEGL